MGSMWGRLIDSGYPCLWGGGGGNTPLGGGCSGRTEGAGEGGTEVPHQWHGTVVMYGNYRSGTGTYVPYRTRVRTYD